MKTRNLFVFILFGISSLGCAQQMDDEGRAPYAIEFYDSLSSDYDSLAMQIVDYLSFCEKVENSSSCHFGTVNQILSTVSADSEKYAYVLKGLIEVYSQTGFDKMVAYLSDFPFLPQDIEEQELHLLHMFAESFQKVRVGAKAPDILCGTSENELFSLYEFKSPFTIVAFLSYDCEHCREWLKDVQSFLLQNDGYELVVWNVSDNSRKMRRLLRRYNVENAICLADNLGWKSPVLVRYFVYTTPSVFVMDSEKTIVAKPETIEELYDLTNKIQ